MTDTTHPRRKWWRLAAWIMGSTSALLVLTLAGAAWWLWSWQWHSGLSFHESWTAEERTALSEFDHYLHKQLATDIGLVMSDIAETAEDLSEQLPSGEIPTPPGGLASRISAAVMLRIHVAPAISALQEIAISGKVSTPEIVNTPPGMSLTPTILAAQTAHFPALKAFITHGANPNTTYVTDGKEMESVISPLICGRFVNNRIIPWEERREMLDFLLQHGANLNRSERINSIALKLALLIDHDSEPWLWALAHGKKVSADEFGDMLASQTIELVERVLNDRLVDVNDVSGEKTPLQALARAMSMAEVEELDTHHFEQKLDLLLAAGANPNLTTQSTRRTPLEILMSRADFERSDGMPENSCCTIGPDIRTRWQIICDKVRAASFTYSSPARPSTEEEGENDEAENEEEYTDGEEDGEETPEIEVS